MARTLSESQVATFFDQGFLELPAFFDANQIADLIAASDFVYHTATQLIANGEANEQQLDPTHRGSRFTFQYIDKRFDLRHVAWCGNIDPIFEEYGRHADLLAVAGELMECRHVTQLINQIHYKKPGSQVIFDWHQDAYHRGIDCGTFHDIQGNGSYVQIAIALDDVHPDSGPLGFIPRSNQHGYLGDLYHNGKFTCDRVNPDDAVYPLLQRGDAVVFGPYTIHGSQANTGSTARRTFINGFAAPGADKKPPRLANEGRILEI